MKTLLITAIAGDIAQGIAMIVREAFPRWRVLGIDIHDRHGAELVVDQWFLAPAASSPGYGAWLDALVRREKVDLCFPMSEAELRYFAAQQETEVAGAQLIMANPRAIIVGSDKLATAQFLKSVDCPAPWTIPVEERDSSTRFPCIFKPRYSAGSKGVAICNSLEEARWMATKYPEAVLQELLLPEDREVTCAVFRDTRGRMAILQMLRKLVGGFTGWAKVIDDAEIRRQCALLAEALELRSSINVQLRVTDQGPRIFEINARF